MVLRLSLLMLAAFAFASPAGAQVTKSEVPGVTNFARLETTVACGGATKPEGVPEIKKLGFKSIINLRLPTEAGANVEAEAAAAKAAGHQLLQHPLQRPGARPGRRRHVPRDARDTRQRAGVHSLRGR